jgi:ribosomal protein S18 acetylase RimI-like enzyme
MGFADAQPILPVAHPSGVALRPAQASDLAALVALENHVFATDRLSPRSFRRFLASPAARVTVAEHAGKLAGYALVLFRPGSVIARLYSIAVTPEAAGRGVAKALLADAEQAAVARHCHVLRLEVHEENAPAARLYRRAGYRTIERLPRYYADGGTALRLQKRLSTASAASVPAPPYFHQTTDFTCGPACMMMALAWAGHSVRAEPACEFRLWREASTFFAASGPGGCDPFGLAVALRRRDLRPEVFVSRPGPYFLDGVRSEQKRRVMRIGQAGFRREADELGIPVHLTPLGESALMQALSSGASAIVLVTGYRMLRRRVPHWVFAWGQAHGSILIHDPAAEMDEGGEVRSPETFAIPAPAFARLSRYGADHLRAAVVIRKGPPQ